jgi:hypothetical protein
MRFFFILSILFFIINGCSNEADENKVTYDETKRLNMMLETR